MSLYGSTERSAIWSVQELRGEEVNEHTLVPAFLAVARAKIEQGYGGLVVKHDDSRGGIPDISVTFWKTTSWIEAKFANPRIKGTGLQLLTAKRLELAGDCSYLVWHEHKDGSLRTCLVRPQDVDEKGGFTCPEERYTSGISHVFAVNFFIQLHREKFHGL